MESLVLLLLSREDSGEDLNPESIGKWGMVFVVGETEEWSDVKRRSWGTRKEAAKASGTSCHSSLLIF
jgi:hypothetical protein